MKETKVYMSKLPESCKTCQFQCYGECRNGCDILKTDYSMTQCHIMRGKHKDCPLIDIKAHDRELAKEVCEKIRERYNLEGKPKNFGFGDTPYGYVMVSAKDLKQFLDEIQKEFEKRKKKK